MPLISPLPYRTVILHLENAMQVMKTQASTPKKETSGGSNFAQLWWNSRRDVVCCCFVAVCTVVEPGCDFDPGGKTEWRELNVQRVGGDRKPFVIVVDFGKVHLIVGRHVKETQDTLVHAKHNGSTRNRTQEVRGHASVEAKHALLLEDHLEALDQSGVLPGTAGRWCLTQASARDLSLRC